jgi:hypothetical protein
MRWTARSTAVEIRSCSVAVCLGLDSRTVVQAASAKVAMMSASIVKRRFPARSIDPSW